jgi:hypothetical protein
LHIFKASQSSHLKTSNAVQKRLIILGRACKNPGFIEKACRQVKYRFFHRFFRQNRFFNTDFLMENVHVRGVKSIENATLKYATTMTAHISRV